jgi:hypothetical protein
MQPAVTPSSFTGPPGEDGGVTVGSIHREKAPGSVNWVAFKKDGNFTLIPEYELDSTHSGNTWEFSKQTNVKIITPRQQII